MEGKLLALAPTSSTLTKTIKKGSLMHMLKNIKQKEAHPGVVTQGEAKE